MIVAIDGPSGAGKSSVSKVVAARLGYACLDTGSMYRAIAWKALSNGVSLEDGEALGNIASNSVIEFTLEAGNPYPVAVLIDGNDVTKEIRTAEIDRAVSPVAATAAVRRALVAQQQRIGASGNYVVEGRDIGTVVFPDAQCKVFLTASNEARAKRRVLQNEERGVGSTDYNEVLESIIHRDQIDSSREESPLEVAEGATVIDSSDLTFEEVVEQICALATRANS